MPPGEVLNTQMSYLCCPMEVFNLCRVSNLLAATFCCRASWLLLCVLTEWDLPAQLPINSSAPCEHSPTLWNRKYFQLGQLSFKSFKNDFKNHRQIPVWATTWVQPLHTFITFSLSNRDLFRRVGEDRKGSVVVSWLCLLLPHRNKSPSSAHTTGTALLFIWHRQQQRSRTVIERLWWTNYRTTGRANLMYEQEFQDSGSA